MATYDDFLKLDMRVAKVISAEKVENSDKLIKLQLNLGGDLKERQIIAGIGKKYNTDELVGRQVIIVANLEPRKLMGLESQGMLLAASSDSEGPILLVPDSEIEPGAKVK